MISRIICGFQTGADQAGARAAKRCGIATGGMMPKGWKTEDGGRPDFREEYGAMQSGFAGYEHRTRWNVLKSDGTIIFARTSTDGSIIEAGSILTKVICQQLGKPWLCVDLSRVRYASLEWNVNREIAIKFLSTLTVANVAGNRESRAPGIGEVTERFLLDVLPHCRQTQQPTSTSLTA